MEEGSVVSHGDGGEVEEEKMSRDQVSIKSEIEAEFTLPDDLWKWNDEGTGFLFNTPETKHT
jgi:hypothetical protein